MISPDNTEEFFGTKDRNEAWIAEAIWGHRLERQPFSALMLEFLGMAEGMFRQGKLLVQTPARGEPRIRCEPLPATSQPAFQQSEDGGNPPQRARQRRGRLERVVASDEGRRLAWRTPDSGLYLSPARFDTFAELVSVVRLLRRITVDPGSERSWTTQFVFPIGPAALYEAILEKGEGFERTRRVFTRTGELAYLMLSRASEPLRARIRERLAPSFDPNTSRNKLVLRLISSPEPDRGDSKGGTYLPYKKHPAFDRMAEDVAAS